MGRYRVVTPNRATGSILEMDEKDNNGSRYTLQKPVKRQTNAAKKLWALPTKKRSFGRNTRPLKPRENSLNIDLKKAVEITHAQK